MHLTAQPALLGRGWTPIWGRGNVPVLLLSNHSEPSTCLLCNSCLVNVCWMFNAARMVLRTWGFIRHLLSPLSQDPTGTLWGLLQGNASCYDIQTPRRTEAQVQLGHLWVRCDGGSAAWLTGRCLSVHEGLCRGCGHVQTVSQLSAPPASLWWQTAWDLMNTQAVASKGPGRAPW